MSLYYEDEYVQLHHGDCRAIRGWLSADVLVTDPPYGIGWSRNADWKNSTGGGGHRSSGQATSIANDADTSARDEVLAMWEGRPAIVFGDLLKPPPEAVQAMVYAKPFDAGIMGAHAGRRKDAEGIYLLGRWPVGIGGKSSVFSTGGMVAGPRGIATRAGHPHAKPIDVMEELVAMTTGVIADPFAGSGSTLVAARNLGRKAIGVELEERYCELIVRRLSQQAFDFTTLEANA